MSCKKVTSSQYKERPSPPYHAGECKEKILKGNDGREYKSVKNSNGTYVWKRVKLIEETKTPQEYMKQHDLVPKYDIEPVLQGLARVKPLLKTLGVRYIGILPWKGIWDMSDAAGEKVIEKLGDAADDPHIYTTAFAAMNAQLNGALYLQHWGCQKRKQDIIDAFKSVYGRNFEWSGTAAKAMKIKLPKM